MSNLGSTLDLPALEPLDDAARNILFADARTANAFTNEPVTNEELNSIWDHAKWAPTAANFQPMRVLYVQSPEAREQLAPLMNEGNREKTRTAPAVAILAMDTDFHEFLPTVLPIRPGLKDVFAADDAMRNGAAANNSWLQAGYFILSVRAHGFAAGPMAGFDAAGIDAAFFAGTAWKSFLAVNIGHPGEGAFRDRLPRLDSADVVRFV
jgi:3-hydroxypropanoate dehydrogenase